MCGRIYYMKIDNILNKVYGRLTVIKFIEVRKTHAYWLCKCSCGKEKIIRASHLKTNGTKSCGCLAKEISSRLLKKYSSSNKHLGINNPKWKGEKASDSAKHIWLSKHYIKKRCKHCNVSSYKKRLDWALLKGKSHAHNIKNYIPLCRSCHLKYDYTEERKNKLKKIIK